MTVQELITVLSFENPDSDVVVSTTNEDGELVVYSLHEILGKGWEPSNVVELLAKEVILE